MLTPAPCNLPERHLPLLICGGVLGAILALWIAAPFISTFLESAGMSCAPSAVHPQRECGSSGALCALEVLFLQPIQDAGRAITGAFAFFECALSWLGALSTAFIVTVSSLWLGMRTGAGLTLGACMLADRRSTRRGSTM